MNAQKPVAVVTGGGTGIGAACCRALAGEGFRVGVHDCSSEAGAREIAIRLPDAFMLRAGGGRIINISSFVGHGESRAGALHHGQGGARRFHQVAGPRARGLRHPRELRGAGFIDTDMTRKPPDEMRQATASRIPLGRVGLPEDVAEVVAFLAAGTNCLHGTVIHVNGGLHAG